VQNNYVSITPIQYDLTDYKMFESMKKWGVGKIK
jgi:Predicted acid phosphatase